MDRLNANKAREVKLRSPLLVPARIRLELQRCKDLILCHGVNKLPCRMNKQQYSSDPPPAGPVAPSPESSPHNKDTAGSAGSAAHRGQAS